MSTAGRTYRFRDQGGNRWRISWKIAVYQANVAVMTDKEGSMIAGMGFEKLRIEYCKTLDQYDLQLDNLTIYLPVAEGKKMQTFLQQEIAA